MRRSQLIGNTAPRAAARTAGFSLVELLVAMAIFMIVGGAAIGLVRKHAPLFTTEEQQTGLNIAMRNAAAQLQIDVVNAGTGYYQGVNIPSWPIGVTIINRPPATNCYDPATHTYGPTCFDEMNVIAIDPNTPPAHLVEPGPPCSVNTSKSSELFITPTGTTTLDQLAGDFAIGDEVLVIKSDGSYMTTTILTSKGASDGEKVKLSHNPTGDGGVNDDSTGANIDPLGITSTSDNNKLGDIFCSSDWVLKIAAITYRVDATDPTNPKLVRFQNGQENVLAEQIIGFKVGASIWNGATADPYSFKADDYKHDWSRIRAVRISLIGRTPPSGDVNNKFQNTFDGGPYKIQAISVVINPRNLSMNE
jgi:prepilin-type N-terminal cleavage/methylation domain-containing protein